jgi:IPT/TIG domain
MIMRTIVSIFLIAAVFYSCKKSGGSGTPSTPPGGSNQPLTITSISPLAFYPGDVVTINGSGFDPDKTKDTVVLGQGNSTSFSNSFAVNLSKTKIISATSTQIKFVTDSSLVVNPAQNIGLIVRVPSQNKFTPDNPLEIKRFLAFNFSSTDPYGKYCLIATYAGDSLYFSGTGFYKPCSATVNGQSMNINFDANNTTQARGFIPVGYFGATLISGCDANKQWNVTVTNGDGRSLTKIYSFHPGPNSQLSGVSLDATAYYLSSGHKPQLKLTGYAMSSDWYIAVNGHDNNTNTTFHEELILPITGYPSVFTQEIDLGALPVPSSLGADYTIQFKAGVTGSYGFPIASFTLYN